MVIYLLLLIYDQLVSTKLKVNETKTLFGGFTLLNIRVVIIYSSSLPPGSGHPAILNENNYWNHCHSLYSIHK